MKTENMYEFACRQGYITAAELVAYKKALPDSVVRLVGAAAAAAFADADETADADEKEGEAAEEDSAEGEQKVVPNCGALLAELKAGVGAMQFCGGRQEMLVLDGKAMNRLWCVVSLWKDNREVDEARAQRLSAVFRAETKGRAPFLFSRAPVTLCVLTKKGITSCLLVDGQHRKRAWELLGFPERAEWLVHLVACESPADVTACYERLNTTAAIPDAYLREKLRPVAHAFVNMLQDNFPQMVVDHSTHPPFIQREPTVKEICEQETMIKGVLLMGLTANMLYDAALSLNAAAVRHFENVKLRNKRWHSADRWDAPYFGTLMGSPGRSWVVALAEEVAAIAAASD